MTQTTSVRLEKPILKDLAQVQNKWQTDRSEVIRRLLLQALQEWKTQDILEKLSLHKISIGKASQILNTSIFHLLDLLKEKNINWTDYSQEDLEKDLKILK